MTTDNANCIRTSTPPVHAQDDELLAFMSFERRKRFRGIQLLLFPRLVSDVTSSKTGGRGGWAMMRLLP